MREAPGFVRNGSLPEKGEGLSRCPACDEYFGQGEGFICPKCKRGPLCRAHRVAGRRECSSCVSEMKVREIGDLKRQEESIRNFLRLLQFLFLVFAAVFVAVRTGVAETIEFLNYSIITDSAWLLGGISAIGYAVFSLILLSQRRKIDALQTEITKVDLRRRLR